MKKSIVLSFLCFLLNFSIKAQVDTTEYIEKVQSVDSIISNLYSVISGEKGEERNWDLFKYLFKPDAKLIATGPDNIGVYQVKYLSPQNYIDSSGEWLVKNGFFEVEINRKEQRFGHIAQVFSTYETYYSKKDTSPFMRGINSIQLLFDGTRWWIINIYWTQETEDNQIPKEFLKQ
ncbi:hypothetical protein [Mangrovimonas aestuarii]|uniref:hypothetical protein n=1 Tax=Mangrovimonas aestuarii TaxID=3018443 RepID=UPI002378EFAC|nr:hypothetical protein [Mangrovimonas aestuarii]